MQRTALLIGLLLVASAGCANKSASVTKPDEAVQTPVDGASTPVNGFQNETTGKLIEPASVGGFRFQHLGAPGEWVVGYQSLDEPVSRLEYRDNWNVLGQNGVFLWIPPTFVFVDDIGNYFLNDAWPFGTKSEHFVLEPRVEDRRALSPGATNTISLGGYELAGFLFAIGGSDMWAANLSVVWDDEAAIVEPRFIEFGDNFTFGASRGTVPYGTTGPIGTAEFSFDVPAGWHHFETKDERYQPIGYRDVSVSFPTFTADGADTQTGYWVQYGVGGSSTTGKDWIEVAGSLTEQAGTISGDITYGQAGLDTLILAVTLPQFKGIDGVDIANYSGAKTGFHRNL